MGLLDTFMGRTGKRVAGETLAYNRGQATEGYDNSRNALAGGYSSASARLDPYARQGQAANTAYGNFLGMGGADAQKSAIGNYQQFNPYLGAEQDRLLKATDRRSAAMGQLNSGMNALAGARVADETAFRNYSDYLNRMQGMGAQGQQAAGALASLDYGYGQGAAGLEGNYRNALMGAQNQYAQQYQQADAAGLQNLFGLGGMALNAFNTFRNPPQNRAGGSNAFTPSQMASMNGYF